MSIAPSDGAANRNARMIIIDGYNFLYAMLGLEHNLPIKNIEKARLQLLERLARYCNITNSSIRVVYDARGGSQIPNEDYGCVQVIYAPPNSNADDHIVRCMQSADSKEDIDVVTSDGELADRVKQAGGRVISSKTFYIDMMDRFEGGRKKEDDDDASEKPTHTPPEEIDYYLRKFGEK